MSSPNEGKTIPLGDLIEHLRALGVRCWLDLLGHPMATVNSPGGGTHEFRINDERIADLVFSAYFELSNGGIPHPSVIKAALVMLREEARLGAVRLAEASADVTQRDPILCGLDIVMGPCELYENRTDTLRKSVRQLQIERRIPVFPEVSVFTTIFSRRLNNLIPALRALGLEVMIEHRESGSHCRIRKVGVPMSSHAGGSGSRDDGAAADGSSDASAKPSAANHLGGKDLPFPDDSDGEIRRERSAVAGKGGA